MASGIGRRQFVCVLGGATVAWPLATLAQQPRQIRRIGALIALRESDPEGQARFAAFRHGLEKLGWKDGDNIRIDIRWAADDALRRTSAAELVASKPDVLFAAANPAAAALHEATRTLPIVFAQVADPVTEGFVASLAHPGGNLSGFLAFEDAIAGKWVEFLKQVLPAVDHVRVIYEGTNPSWQAYLHEIANAASALGVELIAADVRQADEIDANIAPLARQPNGALIVLPAPLTAVHREEIVISAARYRVPAIYPYRFFVTSGGLMSYGVDNLALYSDAASYVDRILKGESPADLPVQAPTKFDLVINLKTAKALGLTLPPTLLAIADEVIE